MNSVDPARADVMAAQGTLAAFRAELCETPFSADPHRFGGVWLSRAAIEPVISSLGITRVGDLTGLDDLDIQVWFASRPLSRSLCVSNGKGLTAEAAWLSAVMESAEQAVAEQAPSLICLIESIEGMARRGLKTVSLRRQSRCAARHIDGSGELAWVKGLSWRTGEEVYAPYELVGVDMASDAPWNVEGFAMSSLGLGAGADLCAAMLHGLRELIEEDAVFGALAGGAPRSATKELVFRDAQGDLARTVAALADKGVEARFVDMTDDIDMPVMLAALVPQNTAERSFAYFSGSACRSNAEDAALAALLEAVQSRLTFISGSRDDLLPEEYGQIAKSGMDRILSPFRAHAAPAPGVDASSGGLALKATIEAVFAAGIPDIHVFALGGRRFGFDVVRVLADDLVSLHGPGAHARTGRAGRKVLRQWGGA